MDNCKGVLVSLEVGGIGGLDITVNRTGTLNDFLLDCPVAPVGGV